MELTICRTKAVARKQRGMTLIELMIAMIMLLVGVVGSMVLVAYAIGGNGRSRQQSNSTALAQMVTEKISSVKASTSPNLTILDCTGASFTISTTAPGGAPLTSSGDVDYTQAAVTNYQMLYTDCGTSGRQVTYDVRWNIQQPSTYTKLITVSAEMRGAGNDPKYFSLPVTVRTLVGQGT
ncbi:MAG TPA: prepilin-type N-terminal cleavage/methylation domain-containing protein [Candidatus Acidoferrales bacterium]|nr:prepilin-type N-terminal cleavage/methylation domain-containing protein [Candidatus Acidoferrales bacterium]